MTPEQERTGVVRWLEGRLPGEWFTEAVDVVIDREEITVTGRIGLPATDGTDDVADSDADLDPARRQAEAGRIARFREETRGARMAIDDECQERFGRKVAWAARCGDTDATFTQLSMPVMTRLRQPERIVLDTLVDSGVARSRSDALGWCVRLVGQHSDEWLNRLREAMVAVDHVREDGPAA